MLCELTPVQADRVVPLFDAPHLALVARSVACGNTPGSCWADNPANPRLTLLWDKRHHLYLAGDAAAADTAAIRSLLDRTILPGMHARGCSRYEAHASCESLARLWPQTLPQASRQSRLLLTAMMQGAPAMPPIDPALQVRPIDATLLRDDGLVHVQDVRNEVASMWGSVDAFLRGGFGYCAVTKRDIICWCTAEYVSPGRCGIGIETIPEYQRRGLATATAAAFLSHCTTRNIQPYWDCWTSNTSSVRVAEKIGLGPVEQFEVACGTLADLGSRI